MDTDKRTIRLSILQLNPDRLPQLGDIGDSDFAPATQEEKAAMVEKRASVSYWKDAARRFKANHVSVAALIVFIVVLLFTFAGPYLIPYDYSAQYRDSAKLGPFEYSEQERLIKDVLAGDADAVYATALQSGSLTSLKKGDYWLKYKGEIYAFTLEKNMSDAVLVLDLDGENRLAIVRESDYEDNGVADEPQAVSYTAEAGSGATRIKLVAGVFPHCFGTDSVGRDIMARCMYGGRVSLIVGLLAALIVLFIGAVYGAASGLAGGTVDFILMRVVDLIYSVPEVLVVLLLQVVLKDPLQGWFDAYYASSSFVRVLSDLGVGIVSILITFALLYWVGMARIVRGQVLQLKQMEYVTAANALGVPNKRIIKRHLLPNCVGQIVVATCLQIPSAIFLESFLSFLGLGVSAPMASLGSLCSDALDTITMYPYRLMFPAVILTILVLSLNLIGDGLRDALDPRLKK